MSFADWWVVGAFLVALCSLITFVVFYLVSSHGQALRSAEGRHLVSFRTSLAAFMVMAIVHSFLREYDGRDVVRIVITSSFALAGVQGAVLVVRAQLARRRSARNAAGPR